MKKKCKNSTRIVFFQSLIVIYITCIGLFFQQKIFWNNICELKMDEIFYIIWIVICFNLFKKLYKFIWSIIGMVAGSFLLQNIVVIVPRKALLIFIIGYTLALIILLIINYYFELIKVFVKAFYKELTKKEE